MGKVPATWDGAAWAVPGTHGNLPRVALIYDQSWQSSPQLEGETIMFFIGIFGISQAKKELAVQNNIPCATCGSLTRYRVFKTYSYFHVFFIPTFRWHIRYFVQSEDCGHLFELDPEIGRRFAAGESPSILPSNVHPVGGGQSDGSRTCQACGRTFDPRYRYCPYCGQPLD